MRTETHTIWLEDLYTTEIEEVEGTIENEKLWLNGSNTNEERVMHEKNIEEMTSYIEVLKNLIADLW